MTKTATDFPHFDAQTVASQANAVLGIRDSGKSYTAVAIAERFYDAGIPFTAFDPIGKWRFMRAPGKGHGYPVVVAGGTAGDLPLTVESAPAIVRAAMENGISLVFDLYDMEMSKADWKRIVESSVRVLLYENGKHGLRHIFIEEAAEFAPQRPGPDQTRVYAEIEKLARMGGNARLGYTLVNQRSEEVAKAVLELCDNLFLHRQKGRNALTNLGKWLDVGDVKPGSRDIIKSLPTLPQGECWAWMAGTDRPVHLKVPAKNSYEPDRRAMRGEIVPETKRTVDVAAFVRAMKATMDGKAPAPVAPPIKATAPSKRKIQEEPDVKESEARALREQNAALQSRLAELERAERKRTAPVVVLEAEPEPVAVNGDMESIYAYVKHRAMDDYALLRVLTEQPEIEVRIERKVLQVDGTSLKGRLAKLLIDSFFDDGVSTKAIGSMLRKTGKDPGGALGNALNELVSDGFLTRDGDRSYRAVKDMRVNIVGDRA